MKKFLQGQIEDMECNNCKSKEKLVRLKSYIEKITKNDNNFDLLINDISQEILKIKAN